MKLHISWPDTLKDTLQPRKFNVLTNPCEKEERFSILLEFKRVAYLLQEKYT